MSSNLPLLAAALLATLLAQQSSPITQPGAPGHPSQTLPAASRPAPARPPASADTAFMQGMIMHHSQAVEMTALIPSHTHNPEVLALGHKISVSQTDERKYMQRWLTTRGLSTEMPMPAMQMDHAHMTADQMANMDMSTPAPMMMPGMLTPAQMQALAAASGPQFDHLFLTGMIQHHTGALTMVSDLFAAPGAAQDADLFDFATDVDNTQRAEIAIMTSLLQKESK